MKLLAIETAGQDCSVAIWHDGEILEQFEHAERRQTERVLPMVRAVLEESGLRLRDLDGIAFGHGPGAFTGVRVATSVTQGLAYAANLPVVGVSTLASLALDGFDRGAAAPLLVAQDARMGELYMAVYGPGKEDLLETLLEDCLVAPAQLPALPRQVQVAVGSGAAYLEALQQQLPRLQWFEGAVARAGTVARLAVPALAAGQGCSAQQAQPVYLRDKVIQGAVR